MQFLKPLEELDVPNVRGVFFDIDDTFSTNGKITSEAYQALWRLKEAGKIVVPVTGRPAGWCDHIARMWPVDAVIGENGAFYFMMKDGRLAKHYVADTASAIHNKKKLANIRDEILRDVAGTAVASDQNYREFDMAIDFCEDVDRLGDDSINKVLEICKKYGVSVNISSIHINFWFGGYTKLSATKIFVRREMGLDLDLVNEQFIFCGDSPNDEPMFEYFQKSIGVANVLNFKDRLYYQPAYLANKKSGEGFAEIVAKLCS